MNQDRQIKKEFTAVLSMNPKLTFKGMMNIPIFKGTLDVIFKVIFNLVTSKELCNPYYYLQ